MKLEYIYCVIFSIFAELNSALNRFEFAAYGYFKRIQLKFRSMMIYRQQNFMENLRNGVKYKDFEAIVDSVAPEAAMLVHEDKPELIKLLREHGGVQISDSISDDDLLQLIATNLVEWNSVFMGGLLTAIILHGYKKEEDIFDSQIPIVDQILEAIGGIAKMSSDIVNAKSEQKTEASHLQVSKEKVRSKTVDVLATMYEIKSNAEQQKMGAIAETKKSNTMLYAGLTVAGAVLVILTIWVFQPNASNAKS